MKPSWLLLLAVGIFAGCAERAVAPRPVPAAVSRPAAPAAAPASQPPRDATPDAAYRTARDLLAQGRLEPARALLAARVADPLAVHGAAAQENARLLALLGEIAAAEKPASQHSLLRAEAYLAWAIRADPCLGEYWHEYMRVRLERSGYAGVLAQLEQHEPIAYPAAAIGFPRGGLTFPWTDMWQYLRGLLQALHHDDERALATLRAFKQDHNTCPVDQTIGEVYFAMGRHRDAVSYLTPASESVPGRRSPLRYFALGRARRALGDRAGARAAFREAAELDPTLDAPGHELLAMDGDGDRDQRTAELRKTLAERPSDWDSWALLWQIGYRSGAAPVAEFRDFAARLAANDPNLSQPLLAQALSRVWENDSAGAARLVEEGARRADDRDAALARFLVAACGLDGPAARRALDGLAHQDRDLYGTLLRDGAQPLVALLARGGTRPEQKKEQLSELLVRLNGEPAANRVITAFGPACLHGIQTDLADVRAVNDALLARVSELGDGQATLMARLVLDERQIGSLSAEERALLARVMAVEEREIAQAKRIELVQAHLARLDDWARDVDTRLKSSEQRLVELIRQRDKRVEAALLRLASAVDENRELIERQGVDVSGLLRWRADAATRASSPQVVASTTTQISGVVKKMVSMVSINANFGPVSVGVSLDKLLDVISEVGDRIMKRGGP